MYSFATRENFEETRLAKTRPTEDNRFWPFVFLQLAQCYWNGRLRDEDKGIVRSAVLRL
jgi:hypothetical protein